MSASIVVSNWKCFHLHNVRVHVEILANQGGRGRFSFTNFVSSATFHLRRNISIGIPLSPSIPAEIGYIQPLVENENPAKLKICVILTYVISFLA